MERERLRCDFSGAVVSKRAAQPLSARGLLTPGNVIIQLAPRARFPQKTVALPRSSPSDLRTEVQRFGNSSHVAQQRMPEVQISEAQGNAMAPPLSITIPCVTTATRAEVVREGQQFLIAYSILVYLSVDKN
jgi:hypothetical protein